MQSGVYLIRCVPVGRIYVGSAVNIKKRWNEHRRQLRRGIHRSRHMLRAWLKYGEDAFEFSVLEFCEPTLRFEREQHYLDLLKPFGANGFNTATQALSTLGVRHSAETKRKLRDARLGRTHTPESRAKQRAAAYARTDVPLAGELHPWWGREHSADTKFKFVLRARPVAQLSPGGQLVRIWPAASLAAAAYGLSGPDVINRACKKLHSKPRGFFWRYASDVQSNGWCWPDCLITS